VLGPRWESVARAHLARAGADLRGPFDVVGATTVPDRARRTGHEVDLVAMRDGRVAAVGEAKLRPLKAADLERLRRVRELLGAPEATLVLASATSVAPSLAAAEDVLALTPADVYTV
jgi:uncharacterized protein